MTPEEIKEAITEEILQVAPDIQRDEIMPNENIQRSLEIDSFDFLKILTALAQRLGVEVPEKDYAKVDTLEHMAAYFSERL
jgi:acyl carrier protein